MILLQTLLGLSIFSKIECWSTAMTEIPSKACATSNCTRKNTVLTRACKDDDKETLSPQELVSKPTRIYFDISIDEEEIGRLVFNLGYEKDFCLPKHCENLIKLCAEDLKSIDPKCSYVKCSFKFSPQFVETMPQYRWAHVLDGRGRNAIMGMKATDRISDPEGMKSCTHNIYGGVYYGLNYDDMGIKDANTDTGNDIDIDITNKVGNSQAGVVLTVPLVGAYRGSTSFSIVRVGESPQEWREKLLLNSAVLGWLESGIDVLHAMARQTRAPPTIVASGKL